MRHKTFVRFVPLLLAAASFFPVTLFAQDPAPSVAEAARRARQAKDNAAKPTKVITDDTLHPDSNNAPAVSQSTPSVPSADSSSGNAASPAQTQSDAAAANDKEEEKKKNIEALKQKIAAKQTEVDFAQRDLALENDNYYSKPDFSNDKAGKAKLDSMQADLAAKKDELAQLKSQLTDLGGTIEEPKPVPPVPAPGSVPAIAPKP